MSQNNSMEITSEISEINIKEELYILFLEIKGELNNKCIEINKSQFDEKISNFNTKTLLNYLKEIVYILLNNKFQINKEEKFIDENISDNNITNNNNFEFQNLIVKYQADIRNLIQKLFQFKIQKDAMETKLNSYKEMEKEYDILKEKVKYEEGRFLNNDRKDNEILILREENSNLKKEILKNEQNSKNYETLIENEKLRIKELKTQLSKLNKKILFLESNKVNQNNNNNNNYNYSTINNNNNTISTKGRTSSRWSKKKEKSKDKDKEEILQSNNSHLTSNNTNNNHSLKKKKIKSAKYSKLEVRAIGNSNERTLSRGNSTNIINLDSRKKKLSKGITTIDNNSKISETYHKILNSLMNFKANNNNPTFKKTIIVSSHKKNSASMCVNTYEKNEEKRNMKRSLSKKFKQIKNNTGSKHKIYNKLMNGIPNSKVPLTSKNKNNKKIRPILPNQNIVKNKSFLNIKRKNKEFLNVE